MEVFLFQIQNYIVFQFVLKHYPLHSLSPSLSLTLYFSSSGPGLYFFLLMGHSLQNRYINPKSRACFTSDFPHLLVHFVVIPEVAIRAPKNLCNFPFMSDIWIIHASSEISSEI